MFAIVVLAFILGTALVAVWLLVPLDSSASALIGDAATITLGGAVILASGLVRIFLIEKDYYSRYSR